MQQLPGATFVELLHGRPIRAGSVGIEVRQTNDGPVPSQQLEEVRLPYQLRGAANLLQQLGHGGDGTAHIRHQSGPEPGPSQLGVPPAGGEQFLVRARLHDAAALHDENPVCGRGLTQPVRHHQPGASLQDGRG